MASSLASTRATTLTFHADWVNFLPVSERERHYIKVVYLLRYAFRGYFGIIFSNRWGFFVDHQMCRMITEFSYWVDYAVEDRVLQDSSQEIFAVVVSSDGRFAFTGSRDGCIMKWDLKNAELVRRCSPHLDSVRCLSYHRSGWLISGSSDRNILIHNAYTWALHGTLKGHLDAVRCVSINRKGTEIVSGSDDNSIRVWSVMKGECLTILSGHTDSVSQVRFLGDVIVSASLDTSLKIWSHQQSDRLLRSINDCTMSIYDTSLNCDDSLITSVFLNGITVYRWPTMDIIRTLKVSGWHAQFHPSHPNILAVADNNDLSIMILNVHSGELIRTINGHKRDIHDLCFTPDGRRLISVDKKKRVHIWDVSSLCFR